MRMKAKVRKLLRKLNRLLDDESQDHARRSESLEKVTRKMKLRQKRLEEMLQEAGGPEKARKIEKQIAIVKAMRKKGIAALKDEKRAAG